MKTPEAEATETAEAETVSATAARRSALYRGLGWVWTVGRERDRRKPYLLPQL